MAYPAGSPLRLLPPGAAAKDKEDPRLLRDPPPPFHPIAPPPTLPHQSLGGQGQWGNVAQPVCYLLQQNQSAMFPLPLLPAHVFPPPGYAYLVSDKYGDMLESTRI